MMFKHDTKLTEQEQMEVLGRTQGPEMYRLIMMTNLKTQQDSFGQNFRIDL